MAEAIDPAFAAEFRAEVHDHLSAIETTILSAAPDRDATDLLFRSFHSIKGLARVIGDGPLETLCHAAESVLGAVRAGTREADEEVKDAIVLASDEARRLVASIGADRSADGTLLGRLDALTTRRTETGRTGDPTTPGTDEPWRHVTEDEDLYVALLELTDELVPEIGEALRGGCAPAVDDIDTLAHAFARLRLLGPLAAVEGLRDATCAERLARYTALRRMTERLSGLFGRTPAAGSFMSAVIAETPTAMDPVEAVTSSQDAGAPAGFDAAYPDIRAAVSKWQTPTAALAEALLTPTRDGALPVALAQLAASPAIVAARSHSEGAGLAVLLDPGDRPPETVLAELDLPGTLTGIASVTAASPTRLFSARLLPAAEPARPSHEDTQVRVPIDVLDRLFGRVGEFFTIGSWLNVLVFDGGMQDIIGRLREHALTRAPEIGADVERLGELHRDVSSVEAEVNRLVSLIHESTLGLRVIPFDSLAARFPRMIRDAARAAGKSVRFETRTGGIRIDKGMSEMLVDPLMHMLRNAVDHGIEPTATRRALGKTVPALLRLDALQSGNRIQITVSDDGRGIDLERVRRMAVDLRLVEEEESRRLSPQQIARFVFAAGFSTSESVSALSGRGVGMDVVLVNVTRLGGRIDIETTPGVGTSFRIDMPLSAAIQPMLLVETAVQTIGFPEAMIVEATSVVRADVQTVNGQAAVLFHGRFLPVFEITSLLRLPDIVAAPSSYVSLVVCEWAGQRIGVAVHRILRRHEMLIRETHPRVTRLPGVGGVTTLGFDRIVLVIDPDDLFDLAGKAAARGLVTAPERLRVPMETGPSFAVAPEEGNVGALEALVSVRALASATLEPGAGV